MQKRIVIPIKAEPAVPASATAVEPPSSGIDGELSACASAEPFALMVLGDSMAPEFVERDVIIIEPEGLASDGSFVLARNNGEWIFRALRRQGEGWQLCALNPAYPPIDIADLSAVRGVIIQKSKPGRRRAAKRYVE